MIDEQTIAQLLREAASEDVAEAYQIMYSHLSDLDEDDLFGNALATVLDYAVERQEQQMLAAAMRVAVLEKAVRNARDVFQNYGDLHAAKPDAVKAQRNYDLAAKMSAALGDPA